MRIGDIDDEIDFLTLCFPYGIVRFVSVYIIYENFLII